MPTFLAGQKLTPARLNLIADKPITRLVLGANQVHNVPSGTVVVVFGGATLEVHDTHNFHSNTVNPSRVTPSVPGLYLVTANLWWGGVAGGDRRVLIARNGTDLAASSRIANLSAISISQSVSRLVECNGSTDYIEMRAFQSTAGNVDILGTGSETSTFTTTLEVSWYRSLTS